MEITLQITLTILFIVIASILSYFIGRFVENYQTMQRKLKELEGKLPKFQTHRNARNRENLLAMVINVAEEHDRSGRMLKSVMNVLQDMADPNYDTEPANGNGHK